MFAILINSAANNFFLDLCIALLLFLFHSFFAIDGSIFFHLKLIFLVICTLLRIIDFDFDFQLH